MTLKLIVAIVAAAFFAAAGAQKKAEKISSWNGYEQKEFEWNGRACILVAPRTAAPGRP